MMHGLSALILVRRIPLVYVKQELKQVPGAERLVHSLLQDNG